ncbi:hypothetical protein BH20ACI1_BH20ACI1_27010 [soil metagenome]
MFIEFHLAFLEGSTWTNMFYLDHEKVTWLEKIVRPLLVYAALVFFLRFFRKRELAQLNPVDLVVLLTLSNTVQNAIIGDDTSLSGGLVGATALLGINWATAHLKFRSSAAESFLEGSPRTLIENGKLDEKAIKRELLTKEDLDVIAHEEGFSGFEDIDKCVLDPNGTFLVEGKDSIDDNKFKKDVLRKLEDLTNQISELKEKL